ncbi:DUF418 domain-containing protein [Fusibacter bizertensis]
MDIIRGFALFGVLLVNLTMIDATMYSYVASPLSQVNPIDQLIAWVIHIFAVGKFYSLFSMLFGLGFYFFLNKPGNLIENEGYFKRRLWILLLISALHLIFVWYGDILHVYAITGFVLFKMRNKNPKVLLNQAAVLLILSTAIFIFAQSGGNGEFPIESLQNSLEAYKGHSYFAMVKYRLFNEIPITLLNLVFILPKILALFSIGYAMGKMKIFLNLKAHLVRIKRFFTVMAIVSFFLIMAVLFSTMTLKNTQLVVAFDEILTITGALTYASGLILLYNNKRLAQFVKPLAATGQMALTNYLVQTIFFTTFFYGYGFGKFGIQHQIEYIILAVLFFAMQIIASNLWLKFHKFGPCELIWRKLTYWKIH